MKRLEAIRSKGATNDLHSEGKQAGHFQSSWQQPVNVFSSWSRPECVQELHQEAQVNLHRLLQDFEDQLYEDKVIGQTFREPSLESSEGTSHSRSPIEGHRRPQLIFLPASKHASDSGTTLTWSTGSGSSSPLRPQRSLRGPPVAEKPRWHLRRHTPAHLLPADEGDVCVPEKILHVDLIKGTHSPEPFHQKDPAQSLASHTYHFPLRKTWSDLAQILPQSPGRMEQASLLCANSTWNGPKGSTFSPSWSSSFPIESLLSSEHTVDTIPCNFGDSSGHSMSSGSHSGSLASIPTESSSKTRSAPAVNDARGRSGTESSAGSAGEMETRLKKKVSGSFRGRSLSTPTDSDSICSTENLGVEGESSAPPYPSGSSEEGASTNSTSPSRLDLLPDGRPRSRSRSISLKKQKKKPSPPMRSVSLKNSSASDCPEHTQDGRPKSLVIPSDHLLHFQPDFISCSKPPQQVRDLFKPSGRRAAETQELKREAVQSSHYPLNKCKLTDIEKSASNSRTNEGTSAVQNDKVSGSSNSLPSPPGSHAATHSQLTAEIESKASQAKTAGLMSPSSGYSSQSETPTPTIPTSVVMGPSPLGCKMRPKIPQRKSSLPATSPGERAARCRLSFELPVTAHLELFAVKPKSKASRRHSDSSTASRPGYKLSPCQSIMPLVTQTDLRNVRLRSVSRSETDESVDGSSGILEEEQTRDTEPCPAASLKPKPPVAVKPPLPKRPPNLNLKSPTSCSSSRLTSQGQPSSSAENQGGDIYTVVKKPKPPKSSLTSGQVQSCGGQLQQVMKDQLGTDCLQTSLKPDTQSSGRVSSPSLAERDKKGNKVPPPIPKKPNVVFVSVNTFHTSMPTDRPVNPVECSDTPSCPTVPEKKESHTADASPKVHDQDAHLRSCDPQAPAAAANNEKTERNSEDSENERSMLCNKDEDSDDVFVHSSKAPTTEDLFTIIHRSKRKVLGRKELSDQFNSKQNLVSPIKSNDDQPSATPGGALYSTARHDNFMALLQKKNSKPNGGRGVSAAELLKSTNPLARRVLEFTLADPDMAVNPRSSQIH